MTLASNCESHNLAAIVPPIDLKVTLGSVGAETMSGILFNVCSMQLTGGRPGQQLACRPHLRGGFLEEPSALHRRR